MEIMKLAKAVFSIAMIVIMLIACAGQPLNSSIAKKCEKGLSIATQEFDSAKSKGFGGTVAMVKATSLLGAAKIQQEFGKYPNCAEKVKRARYYIKQAEKGKNI
jgi:hypothetical protein